MLTSNVPQITFTETGVVAPTSQQVLTGELEDINDAFGDVLSLQLSTPQGQLGTSVTAVIVDKNNDIIYITNQFDPRYASGQFQDALGAIYFITRKEGTPTRVAINVVGLAGTIIPAGTLIKDTSANTYSVVSTITISGAGTGTGFADNVIVGAIACPIGTLTVIFQSIPGWDSVTNPTAGAIGKSVESRAAFEARRVQSVALNGAGTIPSIVGAVFAIPEVIDVYGNENDTGAPIIIGSVTLVPHSMFICVYSRNWDAALELQVATAIFNKKDAGCAFNGDTTVLVTSNSVQYPITFQEAAEEQIYFIITIINDINLPSNTAALIKQAIVDNFTQGIGDLIYANSFFGAILAVNPMIQIVSAFVGNAPSPITPTYQVDIINMPITDIPNIIVGFV